METHLPDLLWVVLSITAGRVTLSAILRWLRSYNRQNRLYQAFRELGRAIRTEFPLRYLADPVVRAMIQVATNTSESFNRLVPWLAFDGDPLIATKIALRSARSLHTTIWSRTARSSTTWW